MAGSTRDKVRDLAALLEDVNAAESAERFVEITRALCEAARYEDAVQVARRGLERHPDSRTGRRAHARALLGSGALADAQQLLLALIKQDRQDGRSLLLMADVLIRRGDTTKAETMLKHATSVLGLEDEEVAAVRDRLTATEVGLAPVVTGPTRPPPEERTDRQDTPRAEVTASSTATPAKRRHPIGPTIGGVGAIIDVETDEAIDEGVRLRDKRAATRASWRLWGGSLVLIGAGLGLLWFLMNSKVRDTKDALALARQKVQTGRYADLRRARTAVDDALKADPNNPDLNAWRAKIAARLALEFLEGAQELPAHIARAERVLAELRRSPPGLLGELKVEVGLVYRGPHLGEPALIEARAIWRLVQGVAPRAAAQGDRFRAETVALLDRAIRKFPRHLDLRYVRGLARIAHGDAPGGIRDLEDTVAKNKDHVPAQLALAGALLEVGRAARAQEHFLRVLGVDPSSTRAQLGLALTRLERGIELTRVAEVLDKLRPKKGTAKLIRAWYQLARAWLAWTDGKLSDAIRAFDRAGDLFVPDARWLAAHARLALILGRLHAGGQSLDKGMSLLRSERDPLRASLELTAMLGRGLPPPVIARGTELAKRFGAQTPAGRRVRLVLARALLAANRPAAARGLLAKFTPAPADRVAHAAYAALADGQLIRERERREAAVKAAEKAPKKTKRKPKRRTKRKPKKKRGKAKASTKAMKSAKATPKSPSTDPGRAAGGTEQTIDAVIARLRALTKRRRAGVAYYALSLLLPDATEAKQALERGLDGHRDAPAAAARMAHLQISARQLKEADATLKKLRRTAAEYLPRQYARARLAHVRGSLSDAERAMESFCRPRAARGDRAKPRPARQPGGLTALSHLARWATRLAALDRAAVCPSGLGGARALVDWAEILIALDQPVPADQARLLLAVAAKQGADPLRVALLRIRASLTGPPDKKRAAAAIKRLDALERAHRDAEKSAAFQLAVATAHRSAGDDKKEIEALRRAADADKMDHATRQRLGWALQRAGKTAAAIATFQAAMAIAGPLEASRQEVIAPLHFALGKAFARPGKTRDIARAKAHFGRAISLDGKMFLAVVEMARLDVEQKKLALAKRRLRGVLKLDPKFPDALFALAQLRRREKGGAQAAAGYLARLLAVARAERRAGRAATARYWLEMIVRKLDKGHPAANLALGALLARQPAARARARQLLTVAAQGKDARVAKRARALLDRLGAAPEKKP